VGTTFQKMLLVFILLLAEVSAQSAATEGRVLVARIQVRVWDATQIQAEVLNRAKAITERFYQQAGIEMTWRDCAPEAAPERLLCASPTGFNDISMRICARGREVQPNGSSHSAGFAVPLFSGSRGSGIVIVPLDRLERAAKEEDLPLELVLGVTMAHEIGHLLLPPVHSISGIMQARLDAGAWNLAKQGQLRFLRAEGKRMREGVLQREYAVAVWGIDRKGAFPSQERQRLLRSTEDPLVPDAELAARPGWLSSQSQAP